MELIQLEPLDLLWGLGLIAVAIALSLWQRLGLAMDLAIALLAADLQTGIEAGL